MAASIAPKRNPPPAPYLPALTFPHLIQQVFYLQSVVHQQPSLAREFDVAAIAIKELGIEHPFQFAYPAADRRLGHVHLARCRSKSARSCDGHKVA